MEFNTWLLRQYESWKVMYEAERINICPTVVIWVQVSIISHLNIPSYNKSPDNATF